MTRNTMPLPKRRATVLAAVAATAAFAVPATANAAVTGVVAGDSATLTGDAANDGITISLNAAGTQLRHNNLAGFNSNEDFDSAVAGDQRLSTAGTLTINSGAGDDIVVGGPNLDALNGGDGNDRLTGGPGGALGARETIVGGNGNDIMIWNNGDGHDLNEGEAGADETLVTNGTADDQIAVTPLAGGRTFFERTNAPFTIDMGTVERLNITSFAGNDVINTAAGVTMPMTVDAGPGTDVVTTGDAGDLVQGGDDVDTLNAGAGGDRIVGNPGNDVMNAGPGDDTMVWNNGDGTDDMNGEDGLDRVENNLGAADDVSQLKVLNGKVRYDRVNAPFGLNVATTEVFELNTFGGNDTLDTEPGLAPLISVVADAGAGNDRFNGGDEADTFFGGSGDDALTTGAGADVADGQDGNDTLAIRDGAEDLARGGAGTDTATADAIDAVADVEDVDRRGLALNRRSRVTKKNGRYEVRLTATAATDVRGRLTLFARKTVRSNGLKATAELGRARVNVRAGQTRRITVRFPLSARKLSSRNRLQVKAVFDGTGGETTQNLTLRLPRQR
jgi:Ca2+-binding RTX toxin-like protein